MHADQCTSGGALDPALPSSTGRLLYRLLEPALKLRMILSVPDQRDNTHESEIFGNAIPELVTEDRKVPASNVPADDMTQKRLPLELVSRCVKGSQKPITLPPLGVVVPGEKSITVAPRVRTEPNEVGHATRLRARISISSSSRVA